MFTGIIEAQGRVTSLDDRHDGILRMTVQSPISSSLKVDQSVNHNGTCLTVVQVEGDRHTVEIIRETLIRTTFGATSVGDSINLERSMGMSSLLDGHIVQGHIDATLKCVGQEDEYYAFACPPDYAGLIVEKGSICLNGVSLTVADLIPDGFRVALIPYTLDHTNLDHLSPGARVNVEFDILGKYVQRQLAHHTGGGM
jgi:riboflavin synthase